MNFPLGPGAFRGIRFLPLTFQLLAVWSLLTGSVSAQETVTDEAKHVAAIRQASSAQDWDAAQLAWNSAQAVHPDSLPILEAGVDLAQGMLRAQQWEAARTISLQAADKLAPLAATSSAAAARLQAAAMIQATAAVRLEKTDEGVSAFEQLRTRVENPQVSQALLHQQLIWMASADRISRSLEMLEPMLQEARQQVTSQPHDIESKLALGRCLETQSQVLGIQAVDTATLRASLEEAIQLFDLETVMTEAANAAVIKTFLDAHVRYVATVGRTDPDAAIERLTATREAIAKLRDGAQAPVALLDNAERALASSERRLAAALKHRSLIGELAPPLEPIAWVNGPAATAQTLRGKVLLIDFWAVWCGPCIATFPHLRDWQEQFGEKGLVIVGATRRYSYDWDASLQRPVKRDNLSADAENLALEAFAAHHQLKHPFAVFDDTSLYEFFGVTGIPQAVLIDRSGRIRMIKVGAGENTAQELEAMIQTLLSE